MNKALVEKAYKQLAETRYFGSISASKEYYLSWTKDVAHYVHDLYLIIKGHKPSELGIDPEYMYEICDDLNGINDSLDDTDYIGEYDDFSDFGNNDFDDLDGKYCESDGDTITEAPLDDIQDTASVLYDDMPSAVQKLAESIK